MSTRGRVALGALVVLAFLLRAWRIDLVHFQIDESIASAVASQIGHLRRFPLTGIETSFGFHNPPLYLYVLAPVFAIFKDPRAAMILIAVLGSLSVLAAWRAGRIAGGPVAAWVAAILIAVCPNAVEYSRRLWGHDLIVFFAAIAYWGALEAHERKTWKPLALSFIAAAAAQCVHLSGILLWLPGLIVIAGERGISKRLYAAITGILFLFLMYLPWMVNELREGFPDTTIIAGQLSSGASRKDLGIPVHPLGAWTMILGDSWQNDLLGAPRPWMVSRVAAFATPFVSIFALILLAGGLIWSALEFRSGRRIVSLVFATGILVPAFAFGVIMTASVPPYLLPALFPAVLAAAGFLASLSRGAVYTAVGVYAAASLSLIVSVRVAIANGAGTGVPLTERMQAVETIQQLSNDDSFFVMQDARRISTGLDVSYVYLMYVRGIDDRALATPSTDGGFCVIVDEHTHIRPEPSVFLRSLGDPIILERLRIHSVPPERRQDWINVLEQFPAPSR